MYSLIVDSSTKILYVCLMNNNDIIFEKYLEGRNDHAINIVSSVDDALKAANITSSQLDEIICGVGPGSYTGVRMAVTVCKMLAVFMKKPLYKISTLKLMSSGSNGITLATIDARRGNAFAQIIDINSNKVILDEALYSYLELDSYNIDSKVKEDSFKVNPVYVLNNKELVNEPHLLVPNYLRDTEAERNLND
ncbi:MAG: tRNA (adenosine(37)-N6)-threonylcarbamoyltransferase complex dimerization subunit type 1 TsaB [Acholeplasmatales bacterium]|nr:tRNA (adenosine(37)-N6)-threonylcarbamoyltransferase complex dimerization subunit type 1 TsaB [Acholeplasmatales bacterium]